VVPTGNEYFAEENLNKTCKICTIFKINPDECIADANSEDRRSCRDMVFEMPNTVGKMWRTLQVK